MGMGRRRAMLTALLALGFIAVAASGAMYASGSGRLSTLGLSLWGLPGTPAAKVAPSSGQPTPTAVIPPAPTPTPRPPETNQLQNAMMGCQYGAPAPVPAVVYAGGYAASRPAPAEVALTFDDGPSPSSTIPILSYLERTGTPATFLVIGDQVAAYPEVVRREWHDGFAIGVHTWDHLNMARLTPTAAMRELSRTLDAIHSALGANACIWFWRPPYGSYTPANVREAQQLGLSTIMWDDDPRDWSRPGTNVIVQRVLGEVHAGSVILMHDGPANRQETLAALPAILAGLRARGLRPVTLPQLLTDGGWPGVKALYGPSLAAAQVGGSGSGARGGPFDALPPDPHRGSDG